MNRKLLTLGFLFVVGAGCTLPTEEDLTEAALKKLNIDKDTALAYTEIAMKQAAMASSAITAEAPKAADAATAARFSPLSKGSYQKFSVTADACMTTSDELCNEEGTKCSYTENYSGCGEDFKGKIVRTFEGDFETYKVTVEFDGYAEKPSADAAHYAFTGKSIMSGTIGVSSASLSLHVEGKSGSNIAGRIITISSSSDMTFVFLNDALTLNGTQAGTIVESGQTGSMSITELKYESSCEKGPTGGTVKTTIDGKESLTTITGCGTGTLTVDGKAEEITGEDINSTFSPGNGSGDESGFDGIVKGTDGGSLLSGDWFSESTNKFANLSIYEYEGVTSIYYSVNTDVDNNNDFFSSGDSFLFGSGTLTIAADEATAAFDFFESGSYNAEFTPVYTEQGAVTKTYAYKLDGNGKLIFDGITFTKFGTYGDAPNREEPPVYVPTSLFEGTWLNYSEDPTTFAYTSYHTIEIYGASGINDYRCLDDDVDGFLYSLNDTCEFLGGTSSVVFDDLVLSGTFTPTWTYMDIETYTEPGNFTVAPGTPPSASEATYSLEGTGDSDPMNDTLTVNSVVFNRLY